MAPILFRDIRFRNFEKILYVFVFFFKTIQNYLRNFFLNFAKLFVLTKLLKSQPDMDNFLFVREFPFIRSVSSSLFDVFAAALALIIRTINRSTRVRAHSFLFTTQVGCVAVHTRQTEIVVEKCIFLTSFFPCTISSKNHNCRGFPWLY